LLALKSFFPFPDYQQASLEQTRVAALHARKNLGTEWPPAAKVCQEESWLNKVEISINSLFKINFGKLVSLKINDV